MIAISALYEEEEFVPFSPLTSCGVEITNFFGGFIMRLTLRTLLAYLDDVLDPREAEELGKKIEESDFAGGLVHRIRSSIGKTRLGSPEASTMASPR